MSVSVTSLPAGEVVVRPLTGALGCEISGVDLAHLSDAAFADIYQAFLNYSAVMFHDQELTQEQFAAFGRRFARLEDEPFLPHRADVPGVFYLRGAPRDGKSLSTQNLGWHADHTYQKNPSMGAMLYARDVPEAGGDTLFASNYLSYEALSPAMQVFLEDKIAIHDVLQYGLKSGHYSTATPKAIEVLLKMRQGFPQMPHPLVCKHPETGRKMLYLNQAWTVAIQGLAPDESQAILDMLKRHSVKDIFCCRFRYRNNSLMLWDNRAVQHSPNSDYTGQRLMWRVALHSDWVPGT
ncbi:MAG: TauD/TfdA family dioxygenase [Gammaproteobacteria bacterium]|jgi:taurine dioxygenase|nr:TauD/TfdA family dioxygenase [Gammaproteobacteria bacterium]